MLYPGNWPGFLPGPIPRKNGREVGVPGYVFLYTYRQRTRETRPPGVWPEGLNSELTFGTQSKVGVSSPLVSTQSIARTRIRTEPSRLDVE